MQTKRLSSPPPRIRQQCKSGSAFAARLSSSRCGTRPPAIKFTIRARFTWKCCAWSTVLGVGFITLTVFQFLFKAVGIQQSTWCAFSGLQYWRLEYWDRSSTWRCLKGHMIWSSELRVWCFHEPLRGPMWGRPSSSQSFGSPTLKPSKTH